MTKNEAKHVCNYEKSRYKSIYPYDLNRVVLNERDSIEGSDFINASYIEGIHGNIKFIASQGIFRHFNEYKYKFYKFLF